MGSKDKMFYEKEFGILNASSDASWGNAKNGKSFSGGVVLLGGRPLRLVPSIFEKVTSLVGKGLAYLYGWPNQLIHVEVGGATAYPPGTPFQMASKGSEGQ
ncbi:hypothetical protein TNCV_1865121 [Trichonephila clavipes]|nr:hypothetical protein TNCV_1865121 [Trichonephila clavipes]